MELMHSIFLWIQTHIPPWLFITLVVHLAVVGSVAYLILLERKVASWVQDRIGPNRVGLGFGIIPVLKDFHFWGLGQPLADGIKFILKEDYRPRADAVLFTMAPLVMIIVIILSIATVPWGGIKQSHTTVDVAQALKVENDPHFAEQASIPGTPENQRAIEEARRSLPAGNVPISAPPPVVHIAGNSDGTYSVGVDVSYRYAFQIANLNIGVLFILAVLSLAVYGVVIGGWASNNKYSFLGGLRATANMISYEIPLGLAVLCIVLMFGTLDLDEIVEQAGALLARRIPSPRGMSSPSRWRSCCSWSAFMPKPIAPRLIWPKPSRNWSADITPNTARCGSPCFSWRNMRE